MAHMSSLFPIQDFDSAIVEVGLTVPVDLTTMGPKRSSDPAIGMESVQSSVTLGSILPSDPAIIAMGAILPSDHAIESTGSILPSDPAIIDIEPTIPAALLARAWLDRVEELPVKSEQRKYSHDFLLSLQYMPPCLQKPAGLPKYPIILEKMNENRLPVGPSITRRSWPKIPPSSGSLDNEVRRLPARKIINIQVDKDVQLNKSAVAWRPSVKKEVTSSQVSEDKNTEELLRRFRSVLNKLTPKKFDQLMVKVNELQIDTMERLRRVVELVHEKAISEPSFSVTYASMCRNMANAGEQEKLRQELVEARAKARRCSIGNVNFIGELFKQKMLKETIIHECLSKSLKQHDDETLECLCKLLTTVGKELDIGEGKIQMDEYIHQMETLVKERKTSTRIRFMMQDVMDLRLNVWIPRRANLGPKTITQIHEEAKMEEQMEQQNVSRPLFKKELKKEDESPISLRPQAPWFFSPAPVKKAKQPELPQITSPALSEDSGLGEETPELPLSQIPSSSSSQSEESVENLQDPEDRNPEDVWVPQWANLGPKSITQIHEEAKMEEQMEQQNVSRPLFKKELKKEDESPISLRPQAPWFFSPAPVKKAKQPELPQITSPALSEDSGLGEETPELPLSQIPSSSQSEESVENLQDPEDRNPEELLQNVRAILDKLSPETFNHLMTGVTELHIDTEEQLNCIIEMVYKKAISEPSSSSSYASMCRRLATLRVPMKNKLYIDVGFKSLLLQFCWKQIEKDQDNGKQQQRCSVNTIKFFIELFKQKLLTEAIMHQCVVKLLKQHDGKTLECLCHLLTSVGKEMDVGEAKSKMEAHFTQLKNLVKEQKSGSKRIRNMIKDVLVLRMNEWVPQ